MRMLSVQMGAAQADLPPLAILCHDVRNPAQRSEILARKGATLHQQEIAALLAQGVLELHLALPATGDVAENEAATRLAAAVAGPRVAVREAHFGQASFVSRERGMLRVDVSLLGRVNVHDGVLLLTAEADRPVEADTSLGVMKCAPLFLPESTLASVESLAIASGSVLDVERFQTSRVGLVAPRERLRGGAFDRACAALSTAVAWYGSTLDLIVGADASVDALAGAYLEVRRGGADLILAAGASATDPYDIVFEGLRHAGGEVLQIGIPAEPGTACWIGRLEATPVLGLASCELFGQPGALDLLLPRLFTGERLDRRLVRELANGGLLLGPSRLAPYHSANIGAK